MRTTRFLAASAVATAIVFSIAGCASNATSSSTSSSAAAKSQTTQASSAAAQSQGVDRTAPEVSYDYGNSSLYTREELEEAAVQVKNTFDTWEGCELHSLRYAGDECNTQENIDWLNSLDKGAGYVQVAEFLSDFHSPVTSDEPTAWNLDTEYTDYQWWLGRTFGGSWQLVSFGY